MAIGLYTSRIVLAQLGIEDYGIYNVVGGVVMMFAFLNSSMASSTQRFLTIELGRGNEEKLNRTFNTSLHIHILIAIVVAVVTEVGGLWFMNHKMQIPPERMDAAYWVFQFSILSMIISFLNVPYTAVIIAYERMSAFAYISIFEVLLKLGIAFLLVVAPFDKLKLFAVLMFLSPLIIRIIYGIYCHRHFAAVKLRRMFDKVLFKEMSVFAGWSLWGQLASICSTQGINIILNVFFGPVVNAARGVAVQVQAAVGQFSMNFQTAINPQITKSYAAEDYATMHLLIFRSAKFTFFLLYALALPILFEAPFVLGLWLEEVPAHTVQFLRIILWITIIDSVANPLMVAAAATGRIKKYQSVVGGLLIAILPVAYVALKLGAPPEAVFVVHLIICIIAFVARLYIVKPLTMLSPSVFFKNVVVSCIAAGLLALVLPLLLYIFLPDTAYGAFAVMAAAFVSVCGCAYSVGLSGNEKSFVRQLLSRIFRLKHD